MAAVILLGSSELWRLFTFRQDCMWSPSEVKTYEMTWNPFLPAHLKRVSSTCSTSKDCFFAGPILCFFLLPEQINTCPFNSRSHKSLDTIKWDSFWNSLMHPLIFCSSAVLVEVQSRWVLFLKRLSTFLPIPKTSTGIMPNHSGLSGLLNFFSFAGVKQKPCPARSSLKILVYHCRWHQK